MQMYLKVREHEKDIAQVARKEAQAHADAAKKAGDKSIAGMMEGFKTMGSAADMLTADIRAAKDLGYNTQEYLWVKSQVLAASSAAMMSKMAEATNASFDSAYTQMKKSYDEAKDDQTKKMYKDMLDNYDKQRAEMKKDSSREHLPRRRLQPAAHRQVRRRAQRDRHRDVEVGRQAGRRAEVDGRVPEGRRQSGGRREEEPVNITRSIEKGRRFGGRYVRSLSDTIRSPMTTRRFPAQLACSRCDATFPIRELMNLCPNDGAPLLVRYDIAKSPELREEIRTRPATMWRYREVLPADDESEIVTLGEGITPLLQSKNFDNVWIKDESKNPTRSFKSRGMAAAVTMAKRLGAQQSGRADGRQRRRGALRVRRARGTAGVRGHAARHAAIDRR